MSSARITLPEYNVTWMRPVEMANLLAKSSLIAATVRGDRSAVAAARDTYTLLIGTGAAVGGVVGFMLGMGDDHRVGEREGAMGDGDRGPQEVQLNVHADAMNARSIPAHSPLRAHSAQFASKSTHAPVGTRVGYHGADVLETGSGTGTRTGTRTGAPGPHELQLRLHFDAMNACVPVAAHSPFRAHCAQLGSKSTHVLGGAGEGDHDWYIGDDCGLQEVQLLVHFTAMNTRSAPAHSPARAHCKQFGSKSTHAATGMGAANDGTGVGYRGVGVLHVGKGEGIGRGTEPAQRPQLAGHFRRINWYETDPLKHSPWLAHRPQLGSASKQFCMGDMAVTTAGCGWVVNETGKLVRLQEK
jgi:hypothetical protein